jgi:hypothetical protein
MHGTSTNPTSCNPCDPCPAAERRRHALVLQGWRMQSQITLSASTRHLPTTPTMRGSGTCQRYLRQRLGGSPGARQRWENWPPAPTKPSYVHAGHALGHPRPISTLCAGWAEQHALWLKLSVCSTSHHCQLPTLSVSWETSCQDCIVLPCGRWLPAPSPGCLWTHAKSPACHSFNLSPPVQALSKPDLRCRRSRFAL